MKGKAALSLLVALVLLAATAVAGATSIYVEEGATAFNNVQGIGGLVVGGENNKAAGVGAVVAGGSFNNAAGIGAMINESCGAQVMGIGAVAIGNFNTAIGTGVEIYGGYYGGEASATATTSSSSYVPNVQKGFGAMAIGEGNTAVGAHTLAIGIGNTAYGAYAQAGTYFDTAIGAGAQAYGGSSVALGAGSVADQPNTVSVGSPGYERRITNVAPGIYGTDAVNMSQLWDTHDKINRLGATAMAMTGLSPMAYKKDEPTQYSAAIGTYSGKTGFAFGLYHYTQESVMLSAAFGWSSDGWEKAGRAGITWRGGSSKKEESAKTVFATNVSGAQKDDTKPATVPEGGIQDRVNKLLKSTEVQAE